MKGFYGKDEEVVKASITVITVIQMFFPSYPLWKNNITIYNILLYIVINIYSSIFIKKRNCITVITVIHCLFLIPKSRYYLKYI